VSTAALHCLHASVKARCPNGTPLQKACRGPTVSWQRGSARAAGPAVTSLGVSIIAALRSSWLLNRHAAVVLRRLAVELVAESQTVIETPQATDYDMQACPWLAFFQHDVSWHHGVNMTQ